MKHKTCAKCGITGTGEWGVSTCPACTAAAITVDKDPLSKRLFQAVRMHVELAVARAPDDKRGEAMARAQLEGIAALAAIQAAWCAMAGTFVAIDTMSLDQVLREASKAGTDWFSAMRRLMEMQPQMAELFRPVKGGGE